VITFGGTTHVIPASSVMSGRGRAGRLFVPSTVTHHLILGISAVVKHVTLTA
jgi:hypothetical protein